jgi:hypothetical protein
MELESYGWGPFEASRVAQIADIPVTEFWQNKAHDPWADALGFQWTAQMMSSAAHLTGKKVVGAEAYTRMKGDWKMHPYVMKVRGDRAFARGINRLIFHSAAHNPLRDEVKPGMTMGQFGFQGARNNTWFYDSKVWKEYIARCQSIFQQGEYVSDFLYLYGDERGFNCFYKEKELSEPWLPGHKFNLADLGTLDRLFVDKNGKIRVTYKGETLPNSYEMLVMKRTVLMTPDTAEKLGALVEKGATVYCDRPVRTPRLKDFDKNDAALNALLKKYWDSGKIRSLSELDAGIQSITPDCEMADQMQYAHHKVGDADFYFVSNQSYDSREEKVTFRIAGRLPELWDPETGETMPAPNWRITKDGRTQVELELDPADSVFVVFRKPTEQAEKVSPKIEYREVGKITGNWTVTFDPAFGPKEAQTFAELVAWNEHSNEDIKYFSGTAAYRKTIQVSDPNEELYLDLGDVQIMARVLVNGKDLGVLWKPPFRVNLSGALRKGKNELEVRVTNLWVNRLIGDAALPETGKRSKWKNEAYERFPDWVLNGTPIPEGHRRTFAPWNHYDKGGELVPSGLLGPVRVMKRIEKTSPPEGFEATFNQATGTAHKPQRDTRLPLMHTANVPGWTFSGGKHQLQCVNRGTKANANWAVMIPADLNLSSAPFNANLAGKPYRLSIEISPTVYLSPKQATQASDALVIELIREDGTVLQSFEYSAGAWAQKMDFKKVGFSYEGDGSGRISVRISSKTKGTDRLTCAIDNLIVSSTGR